MTITRTTEQIHKDIRRVTETTPEDLAAWYAELGALWREMVRAGDREQAPPWAGLAGALLAMNYEQLARQYERSRPPRPE